MNQQLSTRVMPFGEGQDTPLLMSCISAFAEVDAAARRVRAAAMHFNEAVEDALQRGVKVKAELQHGAVYLVGGTEPLHPTLHLMVSVG